jgi:hypothetical protein
LQIVILYPIPLKGERKMKKYIGISMLVILGFAFFMMPTAEAACTQASGYVIRVSTNPGAGSSYIYFRLNARDNYYWYGITSDAKLIDAAISALTNRTKIYITGNASSCPTSGSSRYIGTVTYLAISP